MCALRSAFGLGYQCYVKLIAYCEEDPIQRSNYLQLNYILRRVSQHIIEGGLNQSNTYLLCDTEEPYVLVDVLSVHPSIICKLVLVQ